MADMHDRTVEGLLAYCDWLKEKHYLGDNAVEGWKTAIKKVFEAVEEESYNSFDLSGLDLEEYIERFQRAAGKDYKHETIGIYGRRIRNAIDAQEHYLEHGRPPTFRQPAGRKGEAAGEATKPKATKKATVEISANASGQAPGPEFFDFSYPLASGRMVELRGLPKKMAKGDVDRLSAVLRTLQVEEQPQIPETTGETVAA